MPASPCRSTRCPRLDAQGRISPNVGRLWLPFLFLETGTLRMEPHIERILGRSGFEHELWRRRYRAYGDVIARGVYTKAPQENFQ